MQYATYSYLELNTVFNIYKKNRITLRKYFFLTFGTCEKIEVKRGHLVKKREFGQTKKILIYQFFKTGICASQDDSVFLIDIENSIDFNCVFFLRDRRKAQAGVFAQPMRLKFFSVLFNLDLRVTHQRLLVQSGTVI